MSSGCCGTKKQKLDNGGGVTTNPGNVTVQCNGHSGNSIPGGYISSQDDRINQNDDNHHDEWRSERPNGFPIATNGQLSRNGMVAQPEMCYFCFDVLYSHLHSLEPPKTPNFSNEAYPLFVTWKIGKDRRLRGCIGTFNAMNLHCGLREYAMTSALKDSRFSPITRDEFPRLVVSVSILRHFEDAADYLDWQLGVHGIRIEFHNERGNRRTATYLPEVAPEQGWDQLQTIDSLLRKGGFKGSVTPDIRRNIKLTRYQSEKITVSYHDYMTQWKNRSVNATAAVEC